MTVAELISELRNLPQDAVVVTCYDVHDGDLYEVTGLTLHPDLYKCNGMNEEQNRGKQAVEL